MGWKASMIIINKPGPVNNEELLQQLGFTRLTKIKDQPFDSVMNPDNEEVFIGTYSDNLLICAPDMPMQFFEDEPGDAEETLIKIFPESEICSVVIHSVVNLWGYAVIQKGVKVRVRAGSGDDGTFIEEGEPLEEEKELLSKSTVTETGERIYALDGLHDETFTEDQVGENFVFAICRRYFEVELDAADNLLFETVLTGYSFGKIKPATVANGTPSINMPTPSSKPWWQFW